MRTLRTLARVLLGTLLACLTAGLVQVLYVNAPPELAGDVLGSKAVLALETATHFWIFAIAFVLIVAALSEWLKIQTLPFYLLAGVAIALLGFAAQFSSEPGGQPTIMNNYALQAFLTTGFFGGLVYWLSAGQFAGGRSDDDDGDDATTGVPAAAKAKERPRILVEASRPEQQAKKAGSLYDRLSKGDKSSADATTVKIAKPSVAATSGPSTKPPASAGAGDKNPADKGTKST